MIDNLIKKIRALIGDLDKKGVEVFSYTISPIFTIAQSNITITQVLLNGVELGSAQYSFSTVTNKITLIEESGTMELTSGDIIEVDYLYNKYSETEILDYILSALVYISVYSDESMDWELDVVNNYISPTPENREEDLICLVASILVKPEYSQYKTSTVTVNYAGRLSRDQKIEKLVCKFNRSLGVNDILKHDNYNLY